jgi:RNA polymerase sigma factor (TIGR02999 family)
LSVAEEITQLLLKWSGGDQSALDELMPLVYDELRRLARSFLRRHAHQQTLQPTALVHEAYLRMVNQQQVNWQSRAQFFGLAARVMRNLLVDHVRQKRAAKRGGRRYSLSLSCADQFDQSQEIDLMALDEALRKLAANRPQHSRIVELRFFGGLTIPETAAVLGISHATVERNWSLGRAWLYRELSKSVASDK